MYVVMNVSNCLTKFYTDTMLYEQIIKQVQLLLKRSLTQVYEQITNNFRKYKWLSCTQPGESPKSCLVFCVIQPETRNRAQRNRSSSIAAHASVEYSAFVTDNAFLSHVAFVQVVLFTKPCGWWSLVGQAMALPPCLDRHQRR